MNFQVITAHESDLWNQTLDRFPESDVYFSAEYHLAHEVNGDGQPLAFIAQEGAEVLFYPFLKRPIHNQSAAECEWYDLETVYGYSGPLCTAKENHAGEFSAAAWQAFLPWCSDNRIVGAFTRFNPILRNELCASPGAQVVRDRETVVVNLDRTEEDLWRAYPSGHRTKIRKALKDGLICEEISFRDGIEDFKRLYRQTMSHLGAKQYYYFSDEYFEYLGQALADQIKLLLVRNNGRIVAAGLFLLHGDLIHYHLGGSHPQERASRPNNLLFHTIANWGRAQGFHWLHLGGGQSSAPDDTLLRFKATISDDRLVFYTGRQVYNQKVYQELCAQWIRRSGSTVRPDYFFLYRVES